MDRSQLCEKALSRLGSRQLTESAETEKACAEWYEHTIRLANGMYNWSFAKRRELVQPVAPGVFLLPFDCLKVLRMESDPEGEVEVRDPEIVGRQLVTHGETPAQVRLTYISDMLAAGGALLQTVPPHFEEGCVLLLASNMAVQITARFDVANGLRQQAEAAFQKAITEDRQQDFSRAKHPLTRLLGENIFRRRGRK